MNNPRIYKTLRARFEAAEHFRSKGDTAQASDLNQLTITETLIEILATLDDISESLSEITGYRVAANRAEKAAAGPKTKEPK